MLVSVLMPMRNAEPYVAAAIRSVISQPLDLEIIVIDDGSTDESAAAVRAFADRRIRIISGPERGIAAAFNAGLRAARGEVITRCDADDLYPPQRLAEQLEFLQNHPEIGAVCGGFTTLSRKGALVAELSCGHEAEDLTHELQAGIVRTHLGTFTIRAELLRQLDGCREFFITGEDIDLQLRLSEITKIWFEPVQRYHYRLHDSSVTHTVGRPTQLFYEATARRFQALRQAGQLDDLQRGVPPELPDVGEPTPHDSALHSQGLLLGQAWQQHRDGRKIRSIATGLRAVLNRPGQIRVWKSVTALILKPTTRGRMQNPSSVQPPSGLSSPAQR